MAFGLKGKQIAAADSQSQHTIVLAGHGTGKTAVLADYAIRQACRFHGQSKRSEGRKPCVLVLTHTINARDRVRNRVDELEPDVCIRQFISCMTFHGFALKMVNRYGHSKYKVDEEFDFRAIKKIISGKGFRNKIAAENAQDIVEIKDSYMGKGIPIKRIINRRYPHLVGNEKVISNIIRRLEQKKKKKGIASSNDLPKLFMELVTSREISPAVLHKEFQSVAVDEFQDTLNAQWEMIRTIVGQNTSLFVAGDPGQCIFTWAGASLKRFDHFKDTYPQHDVHRLTRNYRSTKQILDFCNSILNQSVLPDITKSRSKMSGLKPKVVLSPYPKEICEYAAKEISKAWKSGQPLSEIAVLYRFHNDKRILTGFLERAGIPYQIYEKHKRMDRPIVKLIAGANFIIQGIIDGDSQQSIWEEPFEVLKYLEGVGRSNCKEIAKWLKKERQTNLYAKPLKFQKPLLDFLDSLDRIASTHSQGKPPAFLKAILDLIRGLPKVNQTDVSKELATLFRLASQSESLREALDKYKDPSHPTCYPAGRSRPPFPDDYVTLSTIHKAKGGEFVTVYYLGTDDYLYDKYNCFKGKNLLHEILLMNVACSRARQKLTLLFQIDKEQWRSGPDASNPWTIIRKVPKDQFKLKSLKTYQEWGN